MKKILVADMLMYRRSANADTNIHGDSLKKGDLYFEYEETWHGIRSRPENELVLGELKKWRVSQRATGRKFRFVENMTPEQIADSPKEKKRYEGYDLVLFRPEDFTSICLVRG